MKHLVNYCPVDWYEQELANSGEGLSEYIATLGLDGIEQLIYDNDISNIKYKEITTGVHLKYWPYWMDFYTGKHQIFARNFNSHNRIEDYLLGACNLDEWLEVIRNNLAKAMLYEPEYLVWHVAEADDRSIFTYDFRYDDIEVLKATTYVFNEVADVLDKQVKVLFENLWWPGLTLLDKVNTDKFLQSINYPQVGIMLDTGHLMNTNHNLFTEAEGVDYLLKTLTNLGELATRIDGVHLSCSLAGEYFRLFDYKPPQAVDRMTIWQHVTSIDRHQPFAEKYIAGLFNVISPEYVNHELSYNSLAELKPMLLQQLFNCKTPIA